MPHPVKHNHESYFSGLEEFTSLSFTSALNGFGPPGTTRSLYILTWVAPVKI